MKKITSAPYLVWMAIFVIVPIIMVAYFAFTTIDGQFTLDNFKTAIMFGSNFWESFKLGAIATVICLILGYPIAYIIAHSKPHMQKMLLLFTMLPMWMNFLLRTYAWKTILEDSGLINRFLSLFGFQVHMINTPGAIILGMVYNFLPFMIMPIYSIMAKMDQRIIEAAYDLGCNNAQVFRRVIFPLSLPGVISGITMVFVPAASTFVISQLLGNTMLIGDIIERQILGDSYNLNLGAALSMILMVIVLITMAIMNHFGDAESEASFL
jgi:spermidine/putrescine transport system permease protein